MLNSPDNGVYIKMIKAYPLMDLKNSDVLDYIKDKTLIHHLIMARLNQVQVVIFQPQSFCFIWSKNTQMI